MMLSVSVRMSRSRPTILPAVMTVVRTVRCRRRANPMTGVERTRPRRRARVMAAETTMMMTIRAMMTMTIRAMSTTDPTPRFPHNPQIPVSFLSYPSL
jgi:hypothetical protein